MLDILSIEEECMKKKLLFIDPSKAGEDDPSRAPSNLDETTLPTAEQESFRVWIDTPEWRRVEAGIRHRKIEALQGLASRGTPERMLSFWQGYIHALESLERDVYGLAGLPYASNVFTLSNEKGE
jgi:hypothetical protein